MPLIELRKLATASVEAGIKKFIYISTTEAMGAKPTSPSNRALTEKDPCIPHFSYGHSKVAAENALRDMAPRLPFVILRLTGVLGPGDDFVIYELLQSISYGLFFFTPKNDGKVMFTHIDDVVRGIMCAIPDRPSIIGNTYLPWILAVILLGYYTEKKMKLPISVIRMVTQCTGPVLNFGKKKLFLFKTDTIDRMAEDRWYSNEKAKKELAFRPQYTVLEGLQHTIAYMIQKGEVNTWYVSPVMLFLLACLLGTLYMTCK